jgi:hypothetical protein
MWSIFILKSFTFARHSELASYIRTVLIFELRKWCLGEEVAMPAEERIEAVVVAIEATMEMDLPTTPVINPN